MTNLSLIYACSPANLKEVFHKELDLQGFSEKEWHECVFSWIPSIVKNVERIKTELKSQRKCFEFKLTTNHAIVHSNSVPIGGKEILHHYDAEVIPYTSPDNGTKLANEWISTNTGGLIESLGEINEDSLINLLGAAIFQCTWVNQFDKHQTELATFTNHTGKSVLVKTMKFEKDDLKDSETPLRLDSFSESMRFLGMPYYGDIMACILLPDAEPADCLNALIKEMTSEKLREFFKDDIGCEVDVEIAIPKFKLNEIDNLMEILKDLPLFQKIKETNFSADQSVSAVLGSMKMETHLTVDEEGATMVCSIESEFTWKSGHQLNDPFIVNKPFGLVFYDKHTKTILGMGRISHLPGEPVKD